MARAPHVAAGLAGFAVAGAFAVRDGWTLPAFCWSTWMAGLLYAWACVVTGAVHAVATARRRKEWYEARLPFLSRLSSGAFLVLVITLAVPAAYLAFHVYAFLFFFYGLFLSFFAEMHPHELFGRNGFINSDFYTPVTWLLVHYWPMAAGVLIASASELVTGDPWKRMVMPTREVVRIHVMVVAMPFIALGAWALVGDAYHSVTILLLMGVFYLFRPGDQPNPVPARGAQPS